MQIKFFKNESSIQFFDDERQEFFFQVTLKLIELESEKPISTPSPAGIEIVERPQAIFKPVYKIHEEFSKNIDEFTKNRYRYSFMEELFDILKENDILVWWKNKNIDIKYNEKEVLMLSDYRKNPIMNSNMALLPTFDQLMIIEE